MTTLVLGASGATGRHLVEQLLLSGNKVKAMVRSTNNLPASWKKYDQLTIVQSAISKMSVAEMAQQLRDCDAVASCLGHNLTLKGIYGKPRKLVRNAIQLSALAIKELNPKTPFKIVLMNTTGHINRDTKEKRSFSEKLVIGLIRLLLPPQSDNEQAAEFLRTNIGQNPMVEWVSVRPDSLIDMDDVSKYEVHPSPIRSAIFNAGKTSRINVGHFMAHLISEKDLWAKWKGQMPVLYNLGE